MKRLIVTADDAGLHPGMTEGAIRGHREGIVTACSLVANGAAFDDAVSRLREVPSLEVGVHLTLVEEQPLTSMRFPRGYAGFVARYPFLSSRTIERELRAQVERVAASGLRITHLNGHQHLHMLPRVYRIVERIAADHGVSYIRVVRDKGGSAPWPRRLSIAALNLLGRRIDPARRTIGVLEAGRLRAVEPLLRHVEGLTELVTHPGIGVRGYGWGYAWEEELRALCAPGLRDALRRYDIELVAPSRVSTTIV